MFLLSQLEMINADYGFSEEYDNHDENRRCEPTAYAVAQGAYNPSVVGVRCCWWWLRSPGSVKFYAAYVNTPGDVASAGENAAYRLIAVRPAMVINLK